MGRFLVEGLPSRFGEGVVFGAAIVVADGPLGGDPCVLFEFVERGVEGALADLQDFAGDLADALGYGPAVHGFEGDDFQDQEVQRALDEIGGFAQGAPLSN